MSARGFVALHTGDETRALLEKHPKAFLLLTLIAMRAKWKDCSITGLRFGQALIGDYRAAGLETEAEYRHAKKLLTKLGLVTTSTTNKGTVATLVGSKIYSISVSKATTGTTGQQQADNRPTASNHRDTPDIQHKEYTGDSISPPDGVAQSGSENFEPEMTIVEAREFARNIHEKAANDPDDVTSIGVFPPEEVEGWAVKWHAEIEGTGGHYKGSPIRNPQALLRAYLLQCASNQSKRFRGNRCKPLDQSLATPSPFGTD